MLPDTLGARVIMLLDTWVCVFIMLPDTLGVRVIMLPDTWMCVS